MSIYLKDTKKKKKTENPKPKRPTKPVKVIKEPDTKADVVKKNQELSNEQMEALQDGPGSAQAQLNPMIIPDFFNNIRNNYYVANKIIWL